MSARLLLLACVGCGRLAFDPSVDADIAGTTDATPDARTAPDPVMLAGETYRYTSFANDFTAVGTVAVGVVEQGGTGLASTTTDTMGRYTLAVPTGGVPHQVRFVYANAAYFTTIVFLDDLLDRDYVGAQTMLWTVGDAPLWNGTAMDSVYSTASITRDGAKGTINVAIRDRNEASIAGVTVTITPPPQALGYTTSSGLTMTGTTLPSSHAVAFNAVPGPTMITASKAGYTFPTITIDVASGTVNTLTILHSLE